MNRVMYASRGGNTRKLAEAIARGAGATAVEVGAAGAAGDMRGTDILFVGGSIYAGRIDGGLRAFLQGLPARAAKQIVVFGTSAGKKTALAEVREIVGPAGIPVSDKVFHCRGSFLLAHRGHPDAADLQAAERFAREMAGGQA